MKKNTKTALITGASTGVGREIALLLAAKGWSVVIAARSTDKLAYLQKELSENYHIHANYFTIDLSKANAAQSLYNFCKEEKLVIDLLINNAGIGVFGESVENFEKIFPLVQLNVTSLTELCALFGKDMKERKSGSIVNIGSIAGNQATPFFASYAASKSYVFYYSIALRHEMSKYKVNVTCVQPGYIRTGFDDACNIASKKYKDFSYKNGMSARNVAEITLKAAFRKRAYVRTGFSNNCIAFFSGLVPKNLLAKILSKSVSSLIK